ncbi:hypothetical protein J5N97_013653 [Dioscorea zingiberensis]|uniref:ABC transporter domain-containing protein n=1 Tax=Dioscorea zingiberensis TaxID=325984 RepID=A0A9D5CSM7_9LILI|nr:hypothetical protein J5N97_013653 [Dioscorea zingiberensis]
MSTCIALFYRVVSGAILGEISNTEGMLQVCGKVSHVSQTAWIQIGTVQENILFGSTMDRQRYQETLEKCSLVKDLEMLPFGDLTEIGERWVNLSGCQKQRIQLARALYRDADIYLLGWVILSVLLMPILLQAYSIWDYDGREALNQSNAGKRNW